VQFIQSQPFSAAKVFRWSWRNLLSLGLPHFSLKKEG